MTEQTSALVEAADRAAATGDLGAAARLLEQAVGQCADRSDLWLKLSAMRRATGDLHGALSAVDRSLALAPLDFAALLSRAFLLERAQDPRAGDAFSVAVAQAPEPLPPALAKPLEHARRKSDEHRTATEQRLLAAVPHAIQGAERSRVERFVSNSSRRTRHYHQEPTDFHYPALPEVEFHDSADFPALAALEAETGRITAEFQALMAAEAAEMVPYIQYPDQVPLRQWKELNRNDRWTAIHLLQNGRRIEANARHCPITMQALANLPQPAIPGASPNAMFSLLAPGTHIPPHTGVANIRLVGHLALVVPPACGFRVGATTRQWREGEAFVFDDTIEHEAWNDSGELRVVLIFDLWPPALSSAERQAVAEVIGAMGVSFAGGL